MVALKWQLCADVPRKVNASKCKITTYTFSDLTDWDVVFADIIDHANNFFKVFQTIVFQILVELVFCCEMQT